MGHYVTGPFFLVTATIFTVILLQNKRRSLQFLNSLTCICQIKYTYGCICQIQKPQSGLVGHLIDTLRYFATQVQVMRWCLNFAHNLGKP